MTSIREIVSDYSKYLTEKKEEQGKLKHLEHPEDHFLSAGELGYHHAIDTLAQVHNTLSKKPGGVKKLTLKVDGSPSIVAGYHPKSNQFFVATKSAFNKKPKLNYTEEDIDRHHGDKPDLAEKLKTALKHLPKVIHSGIHQGDYLHDAKMRNREGGEVHFRANVVQHSMKQDSEEAEKVMKSKMGIAFHTYYTGTDIENLKAHHGTKGTFSSHPDVHVMDLNHDKTFDNYSPMKQKQFLTHLRAAEKFHKKAPYEHIAPHAEMLKQYINQTVRDGSTKSADGYKEFLQSKGKTGMMGTVTQRSRHFENAFKLHRHLEGAKNALVRSMSKVHGDHKFSINGEESKPEGYVAITQDNIPVKLIDRSEFSRSNFNKKSKK